jgi:hypothetical protein
MCWEELLFLLLEYLGADLARIPIQYLALAV